MDDIDDIDDIQDAGCRFAALGCKPARRMIAVLAVVVLVASIAGATPALAAEYFTESEIDQIRDAQSIGRRIPLFLKIAEIRLAMLGLVEAETQLEADDSDGNAFTRAILRVLSPEAADELEKAKETKPQFANDLSIFSRAELLRGYYQAIDEAMDNIDDAYERQRGDVRGPLEELKAFTEDTIPVLREFSPINGDEELALEDAIDIAELALEGSEEALEIVPKTEKN